MYFIYWQFFYSLFFLIETLSILTETSCMDCLLLLTFWTSSFLLKFRKIFTYTNRFKTFSNVLFILCVFTLPKIVFDYGCTQLRKFRYAYLRVSYPSIPLRGRITDTKNMYKIACVYIIDFIPSACLMYAQLIPSAVSQLFFRFWLKLCQFYGSPTVVRVKKNYMYNICIW